VRTLCSGSNRPTQNDCRVVGMFSKSPPTAMSCCAVALETRIKTLIKNNQFSCPACRHIVDLQQQQQEPMEAIFPIAFSKPVEVHLEQLETTDYCLQSLTTSIQDILSISSFSSSSSSSSSHSSSSSGVANRVFLLASSAKAIRGQSTKLWGVDEKSLVPELRNKKPLSPEMMMPNHELMSTYILLNLAHKPAFTLQCN
jgi:hypothetical protein